MRKIKLFGLFQTLFIFIAIVSCEKVDEPKAEFSATKVEKDGKVYVTFHDESTNKPDKWEWTFFSDSTQTSTEESPTIVYNEEGKFSVVLKVSNEGGSNEIRKDNFVNIYRFSNLLPTDMELQFQDEIVNMEAYSDCLVASLDEKPYNCHMETYGKDQNGEQIGFLIYWDFYLNFYYYGHFEVGLSRDLVFFNITNNTNSDFNYFMVNRYTEYESLEKFVISNDGLKYGTGYYLAINNMEVCAYSQDGYVTWIENSDFDLPWSNNQVVNLTAETMKNDEISLQVDSKTHYPLVNVNNKLSQEQKVSNGLYVITETGYKFKNLK